MPYPKPGLQRSTLIHFLQRIAAEPGMGRHDVSQLYRVHRTDFWNAVRDTSYPHGLRGLVVEEKCHPEFDGRLPIRRWFVTDAGRQFLAALERDPDAAPPADIKIEKRFISDDARELQREERIKAAHKQRNQEKYAQRCRHPKHGYQEYFEPPEHEHADVDVNSPEFRRLTSLERIRILRAQKKQSKSFFIHEPEKDWTEEEWEEVQRQLYPNRKPKPALKPEPVPEPPKPKPSLPAMSDEDRAAIKAWQARVNAELQELGLRPKDSK